MIGYTINNHILGTECEWYPTVCVIPIANYHEASPGKDNYKMFLYNTVYCAETSATSSLQTLWAFQKTEVYFLLTQYSLIEKQDCSSVLTVARFLPVTRSLSSHSLPTSLAFSQLVLLSSSSHPHHFLSNPSVPILFTILSPLVPSGHKRPPAWAQGLPTGEFPVWNASCLSLIVYVRRPVRRKGTGRCSTASPLFHLHMNIFHWVEVKQHAHFSLHTP